MSQETVDWFTVWREKYKKDKCFIRAHTWKVCNRIKHAVFRSIFPSKINRDLGQSQII